MTVFLLLLFAAFAVFALVVREESRTYARDFDPTEHPRGGKYRV